MAITILTQASAGAPALNGLVGSLVAVLDYCLVTTLGWTKPFSGTNTAVYRQPAGTNGMYLRVSDATGAQATFQGYESMTAESTGTGAFPTTAFVKSTLANGTARSWYFFSNGSIFHLIACTDAAVGSWTTAISGTCFGDVPSYKPGDTFNTIQMGDVSAGSSDYMEVSSSAFSNTDGHYLARAHTQIGGAIGFSAYTDYSAAGGGSYIGRGQLALPSPLDGSIHLARIFIGEAAGRRGRLPGLWSMLHPPGSLGSATTFNGAGELAGRTFIYFPAYSGNAALTFETSDTWGT